MDWRDSMTTTWGYFLNEKHLIKIFHPFLSQSFAASFLKSKHTQDVNLAKASDAQVWAYALDNKFTIISKDTDFSAAVEKVCAIVAGYVSVPQRPDIGLE